MTTGGLGFLLTGVGLIGKPGLRVFVAVPLTLNVVLFGGAIWFCIDQLQRLMSWVDGVLPGWLSWLSWLLIPLFIITVFAVVFFTFTIVANFIGAPFNSLLAEKVEEHLTGRGLPGSTGGWQRAIAQLIPLLANEIGKIGYYLMWCVPILILFVIPGLNIAAPFVWLVFSAWMMAIQYTDIPLANHGMDGGAVRQWLRERRLTSLAFGGGVLVMTMVPVLNFIAMPSAVAGATAMWVARRQQEEAGDG